MESLGHMVVLFLVFCETSIQFSIVAAPIYILTNSVRGVPFLHILTNIYYLCSFFFLGLHLWHMEIPGLGIESEL